MKAFLLSTIFFLALSAHADTLPKELHGFELWQQVTEKPVTVSSELWTLCVAPPPPEWSAMNSGPHKGGAISVRVNDIGRKLFLNERAPVFPEGTVITKEKLRAPSEQKADSIGAMIKRASGWEFVFVDNTGKVSRGREQLANCYDCHAAMKETDGVFRSYLAKQQNLAWNTSTGNNQTHKMPANDVPSHP